MRIIPLLFVLVLVTGCAATRPVVDIAAGAGGAALGHELSGGDLGATMGGAAGGVLLSEGLHYAARKQSDKAYLAGYDKGRSDTAKAQYWMYVAGQRAKEHEASVRLLPVQLPEQVFDGVRFKASTRYLRIEE